MSESAAAALRQTNFTALDGTIVAVYLLVSLAIGLLVKRYATSMTAYIGAGRSVGPWLGVATMTGTELGLVTVMYAAQAGFEGGFAAFHIGLIAGIVTLLVGLTGFIVGPLRATGVLTIPEFYECRYDRKTRVLGGILLAAAGILNMGLFLQVGSQYIVGVTGLSEQSYALPAVMTGLLVLVLAYTILGGMISVVITDYVQFVLLSFGMLLASWLAIQRLGWNTIFETVQQRMGEPGFDPFAAEGAFGPSYVLWMVVTAGLVSCAVWPTAVARALAMESVTAVRKQYTLSSISFMVRFLLPNFWGICALVFILNEAPDLEAVFFPPEASAAEPLSSRMAMPVFLGRLLPAGLLGLMTAAMIAAFMSTHDSYLLCWSAVITQDIVAPLTGGQLTTGRRIALTRILILLIGLFLLVWGLYYKSSELVWNYMVITGAIYFAGAIPLLVGGLYWKRASSTGAFCALLAGGTAVLGLEPFRLRIGRLLLAATGSQVTDEGALQLLTSARVGLATLGLTCLVFVVVSLLVPDRTPRILPAANEEDSR